MANYEDEFFRTRDAKTRYSAERVLGVVHSVLPRLESAVDVGCGVGTWLSVLTDLGATSIRGFDGPWVGRDLLQIPASCFEEVDLNEAIASDQRFDLAISLEVAEHLRPRSAQGFVSSLARLSDFILFSAAVPFQGGHHHLNERWPSYWVRLFDEVGYVGLDYVRKRIWTDPKIPFWYRQNTILFVKTDRLSALNLADPLLDHAVPEQYLLYMERLIEPGIRQSAGSLWRSLVRKIRPPSPSAVAGETTPAISAPGRGR